MALVSVLVYAGRPPAEVREVLDDAIRIAPGEPAPRLTLLALLKDSGDVKGALAAAQDAIAAMPDQPEILDAAGQAQLNAGEQQQAISSFNKLASVRPGNPLGYIRLADLNVRRNDRLGSMASLRRAIEIAPESADVLSRLVAHVMRTKDSAAVIAVARDLQKRLPQRAVGFLLEADVLMVAKDFKKAEAMYLSALNKVDSSQRAATGAYQAKLALGQKQEAERFVEDWMKSNRQEAGTRLRLGERALRQGKFEIAARLLAEANSNDPQNTAAWSLLVQAEAARDNKDALPIAMKAVTRVPADPMVHAALAKLLMINGRTEESITPMRRAVALSGGQSDLRLELAKLLLKAGKKDEAKVEIDALAALGPAMPRAKEVAALQHLK
ncbi:MAG: tetratricopeptide repeat protein [Rubrivivax sp.]|nr:tetratricopeptide repeat protein [Rubrivivax sp.]